MEWNMISIDSWEDKEWNEMKLNALKWNENECESRKRKQQRAMNEWMKQSGM